MTSKGFVYVMSNKSMPGLIKVGMSTKVPEERAKELSSDTSTPTPFIVEYYALFNDMKKAERLAHEKKNIRFLHCKDRDERCANCHYGSVIRDGAYVDCRQLETWNLNNNTRCKYWLHQGY